MLIAESCSSGYPIVKNTLVAVSNNGVKPDFKRKPADFKNLQAFIFACFSGLLAISVIFSKK